MTPSPIRKVLSSMRTNGVQCLLMGGQACVLYGGAEFSRDVDFAILAEADNLDRLRLALADLQATCIAVPPFERKYLDMGLAVHFRCQHPDAENLRIDVMSRMRGLDSFTELWNRRTTFTIYDETIEALCLPDLVQAKKTQRDKDWPMIARLVEANYVANRDRPTAEQIEFWLKEMRTPDLLIDVVSGNPENAKQLTPERDLLSIAADGDEIALHAALKDEEERERAADRAYWMPLKKELENLRRPERTKSKHAKKGGH